MRRRYAAWTAVFALLATFATGSSASAYTTAAGYSAKDYASGFLARALGPIGVAFDRSDNLYVSNPIDENVYRFQPGGGIAGPLTQLNAAPIHGAIAGLAFSRDGHLYMARRSGDVVELDQATGRVLRTVASGIGCATGLAVDPISGDLFVSTADCGGGITRVSDFANGPGTKSAYVSNGCCTDGLAFGPDGTLYGANANHVQEIGGTSSSSPGATRSLAVVPGADGIAVGVPRAGESPFVVVNRTDGTVTRVDFSQSPPAQTDILSGGTRGDFVTVDSRGCLFATQRDRVVRITPPGRGCDLAPTTPGAEAGPPPPGVSIDPVVPRTRKCVARHRLVVRVRQRGRVRLRVVRVYVNGKRRKTLRNRRVTAPIVLRHLPRGTFTVKLVARTTKGRKLVARKRFHNCSKKSAVHR